MPFSPQTFSVEEVLASSKMNQMDLNIDEVRRSHKLSTAPPSPVAGVLWLDDTATPWIWKMYDGADWISLFTVHSTNNSSGIGMEIINSGTVSNAATLDITDLLAIYRSYLFVFDNLLPVTDAAEMRIRTDTNNGASFDAGAADYAWSLQANDSANNHAGNNDISDSEIAIYGAASNAAGEAASGQVWIHNPMDSGVRTIIISNAAFINDAGTILANNLAAGMRLVAQANNAIRFLFSSGNISTMNWTLYGMKSQ